MSETRRRGATWQLLMVLSSLVVASGLPLVLAWFEGSSAHAAVDTVAPAGGDIPDGGAPASSNPTAWESSAAKAVTARDLVENVVHGKYSSWSEVATGRFLRRFEAKATALEALDPGAFQLIRRGQDWVELEMGDPASDAKPRSVPPVSGGATATRLRLERRDGRWKIEDLRAAATHAERRRR